MRGSEPGSRERRKAWIAGIVVFGIVAGIPAILFLLFALGMNRGD